MSETEVTYPGWSSEPSKAPTPEEVREALAEASKRLRSPELPELQPLIVSPHVDELFVELVTKE